MPTVYACTYVNKEAEEDSYEDGCIPGTRVCTMSEATDIVADTLAELIEKCAARFGLDIDDVFLPDDDDDGVVTWFGFNRMEDDDCNEVTSDTPEWEAFKAGELPCYLADFSFSIERRETSSITVDDFKAAGIKFHD